MWQRNVMEATSESRSPGEQIRPRLGRSSRSHVGLSLALVSSYYGPRTSEFGLKWFDLSGVGWSESARGVARRPIAH